MTGPGYRSYVVRVWELRKVGRREVRVVVEEIQSGRLLELRGATGEALVAAVDAAVSAAPQPAAAGARLEVPGR